MTPIYLQKVDIRNFRPFGESYSLSLPGPGVTILTGPNGLGKTSFFDAIEWGLTGRVLRLEELKDDLNKQTERRYFLRRLGAKGLTQSCLVRLHFTEGGPIERKCQLLKPQKESAKEAYAEDGSPIESVLELLRAPEWALSMGPQQLSVYLRQTHWLAQSAVHRFAAQGSEERWDSWSGPAGMERLTLLQERLGHRVKTNLTKKQQDYKDDVARKQAELDAWLDLLEQRAFLRERATGSGALSPPEASTRLTSLRVELQRIVPELQATSASVGLAAELGIDEQMAATLAALQAGDRLLMEMATRLGEASEVLGQWSQQRLESERLRASADTLQRELEAARSGEATIAAEVTALKQQEAEAKEGLDDAEASVRHRLRVMARIEERTRLSLQLEHQSLEVARLIEAGHAAAGSVKELKQRLQTYRQTDAGRRALAGELQAALDTLAQFEAWQAQVQNVGVEQQTALKATLEGTVARLNEVRAAIAQRDAEHRRALSQLQSLREQVGAVTQAVAAIATHLTDDAEACPVCLSRFESGELKRRVEAAMGVEQPALASAESRVEDARREKEKLENESSQLQADLALYQKQMIEFERSAARAAAQWQQIITSPTMAGAPLEPAAIRDYLSTRRQRIEQAIATATAQLAEAGVDISILEENVQQAVNTERQLADAAAAARELRHQLEQQLAEAEAVLSAEPQLVAALLDAAQRQIIEESSARESEQLRRAYDDISSGVAVSVRQHQVAMQLRVELGDKLKGTEQSLSIVLHRLGSLQQQWHSAGLSGEPNEAVLAERQQRLRAQRPLLDGLRTAHSQIADGLERWDAAEQLRKIDLRVESTLKQTASVVEERCSESLRQRVLEAQSALEQVGVVRHGVDWLERQVRQVAEEYSRAVLKPVNLLTARFSRALSVFPDQRLAIERWAQGANPHLLLRARADHSQHPSDLSANHLFSEGQLSTGSLSLLFAMSVAFRWSRWRGLLMDDPLQNNDIIHVSAFADVIRNLASAEQYQIVLSTHDSEISDFLGRKMQAAKVPYRVCRFVAPSSSGVVTESF